MDAIVAKNPFEVAFFFSPAQVFRVPFSYFCIKKQSMIQNSGIYLLFPDNSFIFVDSKTKKYDKRNSNSSKHIAKLVLTDY